MNGVLKALQLLANDPDIVLIHFTARTRNTSNFERG